ncbi:hypothetical protein CAMRE0001_0675 [Campylobacter rectus RM3267]|uniref:Uncharacterized protein n=1 Tax=Campylobacter rectus RM3267 TaxID=553218 RepID=B9D1L1_CAMRE|nr:hypothetical protein CAMRE0001_0675 [Campylobacter rectus RM3267]
MLELKLKGAYVLKSGQNLELKSYLYRVSAFYIVNFLKFSIF